MEHVKQAPGNHTVSETTLLLPFLASIVPVCSALHRPGSFLRSCAHPIPLILHLLARHLVWYEQSVRVPGVRHQRFGQFNALTYLYYLMIDRTYVVLSL